MKLFSILTATTTLLSIATPSFAFWTPDIPTYEELIRLELLQIYRDDVYKTREQMCLADKDFHGIATLTNGRRGYCTCKDI